MLTFCCARFNFLTLSTVFVIDGLTQDEYKTGSIQYDLAEFENGLSMRNVV